MIALSQITENRKVETRKWLICREPIFGFCLQKPTLRQSRDDGAAGGDTRRTNMTDRGGPPAREAADTGGGAARPAAGRGERRAAPAGSAGTVYCTEKPRNQHPEGRKPCGLWSTISLCLSRKTTLSSSSHPMGASST